MFQRALWRPGGWRIVMPNIEPPKTPLSFMQCRPDPATPPSIPSKLTLNFLLPCVSWLPNQEAVPLQQIDPSLVQKGLNEFTQKLSSALTDLEKAEAQIGVDVHGALNSAFTGKCSLLAAACKSEHGPAWLRAVCQ